MKPSIQNPAVRRSPRPAAEGINSPLFPGQAAIGLLLRIMGKILLPLPVKLIYRLKVSGRKNLRGIGRTGAITVSNHCQYMEPVFTGLTFWLRRVRFVAEENNITRRDVGWLNKLLGVLGIPNKKPMALAPLIKLALAKKQIVHFYPEGVLTYRNQILKSFHKGAFYFALKYSVPVIPLTEVLLPRRADGLFSFLPPNVNFIIGSPIYPDQVNGTSPALTARAALFASEVRAKMQKTIDHIRNCVQ